MKLLNKTMNAREFFKKEKSSTINVVELMEAYKDHALREMKAEDRILKAIDKHNKEVNPAYYEEQQRYKKKLENYKAKLIGELLKERQNYLNMQPLKGDTNPDYTAGYQHGFVNGLDKAIKITKQKDK